MKVSQLMTREVEVASPGETLENAAKVMAALDAGVLPVGENDRLVGMITDRDIVCRTIANGRNALELTAASCMSTPVVTVAADETLANCCRLMEQKRVRRVPVVDTSGACCGIVSQADIARHAPEARTGDLVQEISKPAA